MGNAYLYYYPERDAGLQTLDIGEGFGEADDASTGPGRFDRVRITRNGIVTTDTVAALRTFGAFADGPEATFTRSLGGYVFGRRKWAASVDHAKTWAGYCTQIRLRGTTTLQTSGNAFASLSSSGTIAANDYVVIESGYPEFSYEVAKVSSYSSNLVTLSAGLKRSYRELPILIRWWKFWPFLVLAPGGGILPQTGPMVWDLAIDAETVAGANPSALGLSQILESGTGGTKGGGKATYHDFAQARDDGLGQRGATTSPSGLFGSGGK